MHGACSSCRLVGRGLRAGFRCPGRLRGFPWRRRNPRRTRAGVRRPERAGRSQGLRRSSARGRARRSCVWAAMTSQVQRSAAVGSRSLGTVHPNVCFNKQVAAELGVREQSVSRWQARFVERRLDGLTDEPRPAGRPRSCSTRSRMLSSRRWNRPRLRTRTGRGPPWPSAPGCRSPPSGGSEGSSTSRPYPRFGPVAQPAPAGHTRTAHHLDGDITPGHTLAQHVDDAGQRHPVRHPQPPWMMMPSHRPRRQQQRYALPEFIRYKISRHPGEDADEDHPTRTDTPMSF